MWSSWIFPVQFLPYAVSLTHLLPKCTQNWTCKRPFCYGSPRTCCLSFYKAWRGLLELPTSAVHSWWSLWIPYPQDQWSKFLSALLHFRASVFLLPNFEFLDILLQISSHKSSSLEVACRFVNLHPDHMYPWWSFSLRKWIVWSLSKNQTNLLIHRYSNNYRCGLQA